MLADYHVHTEFSDDSSYPLEDVCHDAHARGIDEICITDHVDYGVKPDVGEPPLRYEDGVPVTNVDYPRYFAALDLARERWVGRLHIARGLELGVQMGTLGDFNRLLVERRDQMDFAILSIHQVGNREFWNGDFQRGRTQQEINEAYYREMLDVVNAFDGYAVLGHLDLIRRYDPFGSYPFERVRDLVAEVLRRVIETGHGIEVNTSGIRYGLGCFQPTDEVLALYRDLGGKIVTVGSDSHKPEHLGAHLARAYEGLAALGFTHVCTYRAWEPVFHRLEV